MRGRAVLNAHPQKTIAEPSQAERTEMRHLAMVARYYWYTHLHFPKYDYDSRIAILANEFYYSQKTVVDILLRNDHHLRELVKNNATPADLSLKHPHINWHIPAGASVTLVP